MEKLFFSAKALSLGTKFWGVCTAFAACVAHMKGVAVDHVVIGSLVALMIGAYGTVDFSIIQDAMKKSKAAHTVSSPSNEEAT